MDTSKLTMAFEKYIKNYDLTDEGIALKYHHSYTVMHLMENLGKRLELSKEQIELAKVIGLLHDIGRFEQWTKFKSFKDTNVDHADESCNYLFKDNHIRDFLDDIKYDKVIESAIKYHNKIKIPDGLSDEELLFSKMIRDMDKVDIYKQTAIHYNHIFDANEVSEKVLESFKEERQIDKKDVKKKTDSTILLLGFIYDINFDESFDILTETDNFDLFISTIEVEENSEKLWRKIRELCYDKINRGV